MRYNPQKHRRERTGNRSRFDHAVAERAQRATPRLPAVKPVLIVIVAVCVLVLVGVAWYNGPAWRVSDMKVLNNEGVPLEQIVGASGLQGEHYQFVNLSEAAARIDELPGVEAAEVTCKWLWQTSCQIVVQPAKPLAMWQSPNGNVWTDFEGKVQRAPEQLAARIFIKVEDGEPPLIGVPLDPAMLRALVEMSTAQATPRRVLYSQQYGLMLDTDRGARIRLGVSEREGAMTAKMQLAQVLAGQLGAQGVLPSVIDVRFEQAPYYIK